ncbi:MAG: hypothetical protein EBU82_10495 [Flavobacteriia bacterium]|jgi:hypothetical protein|nr:hypothetical protein [Flavobacteriia bacterium]NBP30005.1 hypothetical protein [Flavobacteriia bacterium]
MKILLAFISAFFLSNMLVAQNFKLKECVVIGQFDKPEDRYAIEVTFCELFNALKVKAVPSSNYLKQGSGITTLLSDSLMNDLTHKGFSTYCLINVKGYDKRFKKSVLLPGFDEALERASIYNLYKDDIASVTLEFIFYQNKTAVYSDVFKISNIGERDDVIKRIKKKAPKYILKNWNL